ncbi:hypothetical protein [[Mycoplasma] testudinis]|uniref:hypothetical protein n=1 Tax=[Mycoplasma] testudinis TaxID=33924 RepID=UPI000480DA9C|nr:hypothetical protein [[Mycoplasma] testudinis]
MTNYKYLPQFWKLFKSSKALSDIDKLEIMLVLKKLARKAIDNKEIKIENKYFEFVSKIANGKQQINKETKQAYFQFAD